MPRVHALSVVGVVLALLATGTVTDAQPLQANSAAAVAAKPATPAPPTKTPAPPTGGVGGDPIFYGFNGAEFYAKGEAGKVFALLSAPGVQVNARTSMGLEDNPDVLWFSDVSVKVADGNFSLVVSIPHDDAFRAGKPSYVALVNGQNVSDALLSGSRHEHGSGVRVVFATHLDRRSEPSTSPTGGNGTITRTPLLDVYTPDFKFAVLAVVDDAPWDDHLATPHLDVETTILSPVLDAAVVNGMLGETLSWPAGAEVPYHRGLLKGETDALYEVSGLLEHDFAFSSYETRSATASGVSAARRLLASSGYVGLAAGAGRGVLRHA